MTIGSGTRLSHYEIISRIGAGGMGEVYRATDTRLNREVAIKVLPASFAGDADRVCRFELAGRQPPCLRRGGCGGEGRYCTCARSIRLSRNPCGNGWSGLALLVTG
jgi:serine/threonine protein kinase